MPVTMPASVVTPLQYILSPQWQDIQETPPAAFPAFRHDTDQSVLNMSQFPMLIPTNTLLRWSIASAQARAPGWTHTGRARARPCREPTVSVFNVQLSVIVQFSTALLRVSSVLLFFV